MPHERKAIRDAALAQLTGATAAGSRVTLSRVTPNAQAQLPAISIYTSEEGVEPSSKNTAPRELTREVQLEIVGWIVADSAMEDALDALALEIETAMDSDVNLNSSAYDAILSSTVTDMSIEGNRPMGAIKLTYSVTYHTDLRLDSDGDLDDLQTADVRYSLEDAVHADNQAHDLLEDLDEE